MLVSYTDQQQIAPYPYIESAPRDGSFREFHGQAADRVTDLWGTIYRPSDFDPAKQYPIIDAQYASPLTAVVPHNFYTAFRGLQPLAPSSYAELGFIVISVDAGYDVSLGGLFASPVRGVESHRSR